MSPFHGERRPSAGINVHTEIGKCFACETTFNLPKLVAECLDFKTYDGKFYDYLKANMWLEEKCNIQYKEYDPTEKLVKIDEEEDLEDRQDQYRNSETGRFELPRVFLAPFRCGKETHNYFYSRGFTLETAKKFKVGWDRIRQRVIVPVFWEDGAICGAIGRVVLPEKINNKYSKKYKKTYKVGNEAKYHIYENFPVGETLFPLPQFEPREDGLAVLVEGQYDCMWLHQLGYSFTVSSLGSKLAYIKSLDLSMQINILLEYGVTKLLLLRDNDDAGHKGIEHDAKLLKRFGIIPYIADFPEGKNDPQELTKEDMEDILDSMRPYFMRSKLTRID